MAEDDLRRYFEPFGPLIEVAIIRDRVTGTHRGCAFVTYESAASGMACISALHDKVTLEPVGSTRTVMQVVLWLTNNRIAVLCR
jgi:RNA recognition motif-containing protein